MDRPEGIAGLGTVEAMGVTAAGAGADPEGVGATAFCAWAWAVGAGFASRAGFLQTLENPKAGTAAGGEEARGAYLSFENSARLAIRSFRSDSRLASFELSGSVAIEERRE